jgi:hypothetical protein
MGYKVKIKDYAAAFAQADDFVSRHEFPAYDMDSLVMFEWNTIFPSIILHYDGQCPLYDVTEFREAEFESEEDFTLFMLRWT